MTHAISLTDGTLTVNLMALSATFITGAGWEMTSGGDEELVGDSMALLVQAANAAALQTAVRNIEALLVQAAKRERTRQGRRVFLQVTLEGTSGAWRSEIVAGALDVAQIADQWGRRKVEAVLGITRRNFWEGPEVELELSATGQAAATGGRTIQNRWDGSGGYWFTVAGAQVTGNLPAPIRLRLQNTSGGSRTFDQIHVANNTINDPANFVGRIEGESATSGGTTVADGTCSNGNRRQVTVNTSAVMSWTLNNAFLVDTSGARFWLLVRVTGLTGTVTVTPELRTGSTVVWRAHEPTQWQITTPHLAVLATIPLPPGGWDATWSALTLALVFRSTAAVTLSIDYLAFFPSDGYQLMTMLPASIANNAYITVDGINDYAMAASVPVVSPRGKALTVEPGVTQRFYVLQTLTDNNFISDTFSVQAWYRPRRLSV